MDNSGAARESRVLQGTLTIEFVFSDSVENWTRGHSCYSLTQFFSFFSMLRLSVCLSLKVKLYYVQEYAERYVE